MDIKFIKEIRIKYRGEIIVHDTHVNEEYYDPTKKRIDSSTGIIDLSERDHEELYHINKLLTNSVVNICFTPHRLFNYGIFKMLWESDEALKDRVLQQILGLDKYASLT